MASSASFDSLSASPKAKPPATIQITLQLISCRSFALTTPVKANTDMGNMATVLAPTPVNLSNIHSKTVIQKVTAITGVRHPRCISPSICRSISFFLNGKKVFNRYHPMSNRMMVSGNMKAIHCPKPNPRFNPLGSLRYFRAMALGGVPIGVPIPPILAATGMANVRATRPLPSGGNALNTGVRKVNIMAAVAVLDTNMEKAPVMRINPRRTISDRLPKGRNNARAKKTSSPDLVAAMANMKPPKKRMMIGSAKVAINAL